MSDGLRLNITELGRPFTANQHRKLRSPQQRAAQVDEWRTAAYYHAHGKPRLTPPVHVVAWPTYASGRSPQDAGACFPAVKAVIDGVCDAHLLPDDNPHYVCAVTLRAGRVTGTDGLIIEIHETPATAFDEAGRFVLS